MSTRNRECSGTMPEPKGIEQGGTQHGTETLYTPRIGRVCRIGCRQKEHLGDLYQSSARVHTIDLCTCRTAWSSWSSTCASILPSRKLPLRMRLDRPATDCMMGFRPKTITTWWRRHR